MKTELSHSMNNLSSSPYCSDNSYHILVVDDDEYYNKLLWQTLVNISQELRIVSSKNIDIASYLDGNTFLADLDEEKYDQSKLIVFLDYYLSGSLRGIKIINRLMQLDPKPKVVVVSGVRNKETSIETINAGAYAYLSKDSCTPLVCRILLEQLLLE